MLLRGRRKIIVDYQSEDLKRIDLLANALNSALAVHNLNRGEIEYLINYQKGVQPILGKEKTVRPEINNKLVLNHAVMATRLINGYFMGTPIQYILSGNSNKKELLDELNRYVQYEDKASVDKEIAEYQSITGTAYRIILRDSSFIDEVPFEDKALSPVNTFVAYANNILETPLFGVTYHQIKDEKGNVIGTKYHVFTEFGQYTFVSKELHTIKESDIRSGMFEAYNLGGIPIIEYPNNLWRIGDWELTINLMDAINALHSGRLDDIEQIVESLIVFINADINKEVYDEMREAGVVMLNTLSTNSADVKVIENSLDQSGMNMFASELEELLYAILGIPNRNLRAGGGGDTGQAVELRNGWADLEVVARNKELVFKKAEKQALKIILNMFNIGRQEKLELIDIDIKFTRNKNNNLLVKTQSYETLLRTKTLTPEDCLSIVDLVSDVNEFINRGKAFWGEEFGNKKSSENTGENNDDNIQNTMNIDNFQ